MSVFRAIVAVLAKSKPAFLGLALGSVFGAGGYQLIFVDESPRPPPPPPPIQHHAYAVINGPAKIQKGAGEAVLLDASKSFSSAGNPLEYKWSQIAGPELAVSGLLKSTNEIRIPYPAPQKDETVLIKLEVRDAKIPSAVGTANIEIEIPGCDPNLGDSDCDGISDIIEKEDFNGLDEKQFNYAVSYAAGTAHNDNTTCIVGAVNLPSRGPGFSQDHGCDGKDFKNRDDWGTLETIQCIEAVGKSLVKSKICPADTNCMTITDISLRYGGPFYLANNCSKNIVNRANYDKILEQFQSVVSEIELYKAERTEELPKYRVHGKVDHKEHRLGLEIDVRYIDTTYSGGALTLNSKSNPTFNQSATTEAIRSFFTLAECNAHSVLISPHAKIDNKTFPKLGVDITPEARHNDHFHVRLPYSTADATKKLASYEQCFTR